MLGYHFKVPQGICPLTFFTCPSNWMSMYFPKRLELSFFSVLALPKACKRAEIGLHLNVWQTFFFYSSLYDGRDIRPRGWGWTWAFCPGQSWAGPCSDSWRHNTAESSWRPRSSLLHSHQRWGWNGCWTLSAWFGRRCLPRRSCRDGYIS